MDKPTQDEISAAFAQGQAFHAKHGVSHIDGKHGSPYRHETHHPDLISAWLAGFDRAKNKRFS